MVEAAHEASTGHERRYRKLIENIQDTVTVVDAAGAPIWTSARSRGDLGYDSTFWDDADLFALVHPDDRPSIESGLVDVLAEPLRSVSGETRLRRPDGSYGHVGYQAVNRLDDPDIAGIVITARPIDDEVRARIERDERRSELEAALAERALFIAGLSHEMRSPLHAIMGVAELMLASPLIDSATERHLQLIGRESNALRVMLDELLDFSKISANRLELLSEPLSPGAVADAVAESHGADARKKGLGFSVSIDPSVPLVVLGDEHRLRQILVNLVSNAIKYTEEGKVELRVRQIDGFSTEFAVADTGPGIPETSWPTLFEPYRQARPEDTTKGTGLGLVITKRLVELMNGGLTFDTGRDGTRFVATIPFEKAKRTSDRAVVTERPMRRDSGGLSVLVVDDSAVNLMLASSQLERLGHMPTTVSSGSDALEILAVERFDIILMDWHMPHMDGLDTTRRIRGQESAGERIPIIATTASAMAGDRETCLDAGMDDYLPKPVSLTELETMIDRWSDVAPDPIAAPAAVEQTVVDRLIAELGDPDVVATVISTFLDELPAWRSQLTDGVASHDFATARRAAHTLKSTAALLGASELSARCADFEAADGDAQTSSELLGPLLAQADRAMVELDEMRTELLTERRTVDKKREIS